MVITVLPPFLELFDLLVVLLLHYLQLEILGDLESRKEVIHCGLLLIGGPFPFYRGGLKLLFLRAEDYERIRVALIIGVTRRDLLGVLDETNVINEIHEIKMRD